ncbi:MAG: site-2 protease family protein, partial [Pseudomonadota bacterium]
NIGLGIFNLLPLPPLDGAHVLENLLPPGASRKYRQMGRYAPFILITIMLMDRFFQTEILGKVIGYPLFLLARLFGGDNFFRLLRFL